MLSAANHQMKMSMLTNNTGKLAVGPEIEPHHKTQWIPKTISVYC